MHFKAFKIYKVISVILLVAVMVTIFVLSHQDGTKSSETSGFVTKLFSIIFGDNVPEELVRTFGHFSEFAALGFLMLNCIYAFRLQLKPVISAFLSWGYAWTDEIHQIFVDGRAFQISDLMVDLAGIILGTLIIFIILKIAHRKTARNSS